MPTRNVPCASAGIASNAAPIVALKSPCLNRFIIWTVSLFRFFERVFLRCSQMAFHQNGESNKTGRHVVIFRVHPMGCPYFDHSALPWRAIQQQQDQDRGSVIGSTKFQCSTGSCCCYAGLRGLERQYTAAPDGYHGSYPVHGTP
jgi:hypothetical protein